MKIIKEEKEYCVFTINGDEIKICLDFLNKHPDIMNKFLELEK